MLQERVKTCAAAVTAIDSLLEAANTKMEEIKDHSLQLTTELASCNEIVEVRVRPAVRCGIHCASCLIVCLTRCLSVFLNARLPQCETHSRGSVAVVDVRAAPGGSVDWFMACALLPDSELSCTIELHH